MPRFLPSRQANAKSFHHRASNGLNPSVGTLPMRFAHGVQLSAMPKTVADVMPVRRNQSRSLRIPSSVTCAPIQCHHTPACASGGGLRNSSSGVAATAADARNTAPSAKHQAQNDNLSTFIPQLYQIRALTNHFASMTIGFGKTFAPDSLQFALMLPAKSFAW